MQSQTLLPLGAVPGRAAIGERWCVPWWSRRACAVALFALAGAVLAPAPLATLLLVAPVLEEVVFRGGLQEALLRHLGRRRAGAVLNANLLTALAFAAAHIAARPGLLVGLTVLPALLIGYVYQRGRRVTPCIALHALFNATWLLWAGVSV